MSLTRPILAVALVAGLTSGIATASYAQQKSSPPVPASAAPQLQLSDAEIKTFAAAAAEMRDLNRKWMPRFEAAQKQSPQAAEEVRKQAVAEMSKAVQAKGISVERYNEIHEVAEADAALNRRITAQMPGK